MGYVGSFLEKAVYCTTGKQQSLLLQHSSYGEEFYHFNGRSVPEGARWAGPPPGCVSRAASRAALGGGGAAAFKEPDG